MKTKLITYFNIKVGIYKTSMSIITAYELAKDKNISSLRGTALFKELWTRDKYYLEKEDNDIKATVLVGYEKQRTKISYLFDQYLQKFDELKDIMLDSFIRRST